MSARLRTSSPLLPVASVTIACALIVGGVTGYKAQLGILAAAGLAFVVLVFVDLLMGFAVMVLFAFLEAYSTFGGVSVTKLAGVLLVVSWLAALTAGGGRTRNFFSERPGLTYLLLLFLGWAAISVAWSESRSAALSSVMRYALNIVLIPIAYAAVRGRRDVVRILAALVAGASVAAVSGIIARPSASEIDLARATGTVGDPNQLAAALVVGIALAAAFAVNRHVSAAMRLLALLIVVLCLGALLTTLSRGGLLGLGAAVVFAVVVAGRWRPRVLAGSLAVVVAAIGYFVLLASLPAKERVLNVGGGTGRLDLWTVAGRMIAAHPLNGTGTGQFATVSVHYLLRPGAIQRGDFILSTPKVAHNTYLNVVAELGIVGGALFAAIVLACAGCSCLAIRHFRQAGDERLEILARGVAVALAGYLVTLLFISENYSKLMWVLFALGPALLAVARDRSAEARAPDAPMPVRHPGRPA